MSTSATALLVVDVQESFRHRPYWRDSDVPFFVEHLRALIAGAQSRGIPVIQVFHVEDSGPFSLQSGLFCGCTICLSPLMPSSTSAVIARL
jgi:nicotinamidase-related amidase